MKEDAQGPPANKQQSGDPILDVTDCTACAFSATPMDLNFFFSFLFWLCCVACSISDPQTGTELGPWQWKPWIPATRPWGNSLKFYSKEDQDKCNVCLLRGTIKHQRLWEAKKFPRNQSPSCASQGHTCLSHHPSFSYRRIPPAHLKKLPRTIEVGQLESIQTNDIRNIEQAGQGLFHLAEWKPPSPCKRG